MKAKNILWGREPVQLKFSLMSHDEREMHDRVVGRDVKLGEQALSKQVTCEFIHWMFRCGVYSDFYNFSFLTTHKQ